MRNTITITSKGQTTIPVTMRRKIGLNKMGGTLQISYNEGKGEMTISKPLSVTELSERLSRHIKPVTKPLTDVDTYYQTKRAVKK